MKGHELLAALKKLSASQLEFEVETEGCDCFGDVVSVSVDEHEDPPTINLWRSPDGFIAIKKS